MSAQPRRSFSLPASFQKVIALQSFLNADNAAYPTNLGIGFVIPDQDLTCNHTFEEDVAITQIHLSSSGFFRATQRTLVAIGIRPPGTTLQPQAINNNTRLLHSHIHFGIVKVGGDPIPAGVLSDTIAFPWAAAVRVLATEKICFFWSYVTRVNPPPNFQIDAVAQVYYVPLAQSVEFERNGRRAA